MSIGGMEARVGAESLEAFHRDLGDAEHRLPRELEQAADDVAEATAREARTRAYSLGSTAAHVAPSIGSHDAEVTLGGGEQWAMAPGAEFGRDRYHQFRPYTGGGEDAGYFLYPTIRDHDNDQVERFADGIDDALGEAFS